MVNFKWLIKEDVLVFLDDVLCHTKGYEVYLAGGYLRDMYYQKYFNTDNIMVQPKDVDIIFVPVSEGKELPVLGSTYINYDVMAKDIPNVRDNVERVRGMFATWLSTPDVQFIVYDKYLTIQQLAEDMDCNINQAMYNIATGESFCTEAFVQGHENKVIELLHTFETTRMCNRIIRMNKKFPSYTVVHNISEEDWLEATTKPKVKGGVHCGSFIEE